MTKNEAKQKVLDAVADLAQVELDASGDYLHFLNEVEEAISERINRLVAYEINVATGHIVPAEDAPAEGVYEGNALVRMLNERAAERSEGCCNGGCLDCNRHNEKE